MLVDIVVQRAELCESVLDDETGELLLLLASLTLEDIAKLKV